MPTTGPAEGDVPEDRSGPGRFYVPAPAAPPAAPRRGRTTTPDPGASAASRRRAPATQQPSSRRSVPGGRRSAPRARRRRRRWLLLTPLVVLGVLLAGSLWWAWSTFQRIERVDLEAVLDPVAGDATNYLLVGSDARDEFDPEGDSGVEGRRSDTLILLRTTADAAVMMSIPRDLWVRIADTGEMGRINGAYNRGPANLVQTVKDALGVPVNHYMEVGFGSFAGMVDALGGVAIDFPHPAFDPASGLSVAEAGPVVLDGPQALAYARSRTYTEVIDGRDVVDPTGDLGRQERQQQFLRTLLGDIGGSRNPVRLARVGDAVSSELIIDSGLGFFEALSLVRTLSGVDPETLLLPVEGVRRGAAAVLVTVEPDAQVVLERFR